ncbi:MFS transporter [Sneathiella glossodoripedis]|uniref:MFS transporter n=1 Tax=Sneathiella glossodoripedis TaxID=418853 RepID=UPI0004717138|nr:MFS transporter [Sneathiella glossodoripedis]
MSEVSYSKNQAARRLTGYYSAFFAVYGIAIPLWPRWLEEQITLEYVGIVLGAAYWLKLLVVPISSSIADSVGDRRRVMIVLSVMVLAGVLALQLTDSWILYAAIWGLAGAALSTGVPLSDGLSMRLGQILGIEFGKVRRWGSVSFIFSSLIVGALADFYGLDAIYWTLLFTSVLLIGASITVPKVYTPPDPERVPLFRPLSLPNFPLFLVTVALLLSTHAALYGFSAIYWKSLGYSNFTITILWIIAVIAEIGMFSISGRLIKRFGAMPMISVAAIGGIIRWVLLATQSEIYFLVFAQILHALTFALLYMALIAYMSKRIPPSISASAQGLYDSLAMGVFFGLLTMLAGFLFEMQPAYSFYLMAVCSACGLLLSLVLLVRVRAYERHHSEC